ELVGIALVALGLGLAAALASYAPGDPSFFNSTDAPVSNIMGHYGAIVAAGLFMIIGLGSWAIVAVLVVWGARLVLHRGETRLFCLIFSPIWVFTTSIYASGIPVPESWTLTVGQGGYLGDMLMGICLSMLPFGVAAGVNMIMLALGVVFVGLGAFVLGFTWSEILRLCRFLIIGIIMVYATLMTLLGRGARGAVHAAATLQARNAARREEHQRKRDEVTEFYTGDTGDLDDGDALVTELSSAPILHAERPQGPPRQGLLSRMPSLVRRPDPLPEPELIETQAPDLADLPPGEDRIKARISQAVRAKVEKDPSLRADPPKPLTKGRGHGPKPLMADITPSEPVLPQEPPLTARPPVDAELRPSQPMAAAPSASRRTLPQAPVFPPPEMDIYVDDDDITHFEAFPDPIPAAPPAKVAIPTMPAKKVVQQPDRKALQPSRRAQAEAQPQLAFDEAEAEFQLPPLNLLMSPDSIERHILSDEALEENARMLENVLDDYGVKGEIVSVRPGPVVTMYELEPAPGLKASRVIGLADDIARSMSALSARVSTVPGRSVIGIELPNDNREMVALREILSSRDYDDVKHKLPLALGKDIGGSAMVANLAKMPHLLIAGTTGSGKSVAINTMILSLLYKLTPDDCRLIMIDPKMLELSVYDGIPHLLSPVVTDPKKAVVALKWVVGEMEERYRKMSKMGVRNIDGYNSRVEDALSKAEMFSRTVQTGFDDDTGEPVFETEEFEPRKMPYIVVIVDEMADLMMVAGKEIEACIQRLAQMARASGIHLVMATQRPSVDVITGTIKANFPTRISFQVTSKIDSRTILGEMGAEQLLGMGDMLYMAGGSKITRCHAPFVSDEEVEEIVNHLKAFGPPDYVGGVVDGPDDEKADNIDAVLGLGGNTDGEDALYDQAVAIVIRDRKCSTSYIQRKLAIGYNKAARLVEQMEDQGVVSAANHVGKREILVPEQ
ncbi:MAG: DNA translocase FtsK 4TM domain-containing protein, partial [Rhodobacteraceae bacterium]|nr:DNA translocase FtsK 4TM domain-containing protein [Paracoccaceae bacterium]